MIFIKDMKNMKIYKKPFFLPTMETESSSNKKTGSIIYLLTPNRTSSLNLMTHPLTINRMRYRSYYIERDLTYFISSKVLNSNDDEDLEENYITDNDNVFVLKEEYTDSDEDEVVKFVNKLRITGYSKDVNFVCKFFDPEVYCNIFTKEFGWDPDIEEIPIIHIELGEFPTYDEYYSCDIQKTDEGTELFLHIPRYKEGFAVDQYIATIINFVIRSIIVAKYPNIQGSELPAIFADNITGSDSIQGKWGRWLLRGIEDEGDIISEPSMNVSEYLECCKKDDYKTVFKKLYNRFKDITILNINSGYQRDIHEDYRTEPISVENLYRKFKYLSATKAKYKIRKGTNEFKRKMQRINFNPAIEIPQMPSSSGDSYSEEGISISALDNLTEGVDYININNDHIIIFEDAKYDPYLKRFLYKDRIKQRKQILDMDKQIKADCSDILYAFPEIEKYMKKNLFVDLYYYNQVFFKNAHVANIKTFMEIYLDLLNRLINDPRFKAAGYTKKSLFIPVLDWNANANTKMWMFREDMNPISVIYQLMYRTPDRLKTIFGDMDIIFFDTNRYFKINFGKMGSGKDIQKQAQKFRMFITKIEAHETFDIEDEAEESNDTPEAIKTDIYDRIEVTKGIDLTGKEKKTSEVSSINIKPATPLNKQPVIPKDNSITNQISVPVVKEKNNKLEKDSVSNIKKDIESKENLSLNADEEAQRIKDENIAKFATIIDKAANSSTSVEDALDTMDLSRSEIIDILNTIDSMKSNTVDISASRASRINTLNNALLDKDIKGKTVKELLSDNPSDQPLPKMSLNLATPNVEWKDLSYVNFDKNYDLDRDIVACFAHFGKVSMPIGIRNIKVEDTSTSEDRVNLYTVDMEDFRGQRFTIKLDIPIMKDNRFLLRGNAKVIATQFLNMPILKTAQDAAQINTNYQKIFIYKFRESTGCSNPISSRIIKSLLKYNGKGLDIKSGDNSRVCNKYNILPIDYIDIAGVIDNILIKKSNIKIYFNQDDIRKEFEEYIDDSKGIPFGYDRNSKEILYYSNTSTLFSQVLLNFLNVDEEFFKLFKNNKSTSRGTYSQCSIMSTRIPMIVVLGYLYGLTEVLKRANISYQWKEKISNEERHSWETDYIRFNDGYLVYINDYSSCLLLNGLKDCPTDMHSVGDIDKKNMFLEFLGLFGGKIKADGIENFKDLLIDPITEEVLQHYKLPTDFLDLLLYANNLMADNKYIKHTDTSSRRIRRAEMVAAYCYEVLASAYGTWANKVKHSSGIKIGLQVKRSAVIDLLLQAQISQDDSINNALGALEETNNITFKGKAGLNSDRAYSLDKRNYDESMINILGQSTNFSASVGINRAATIDMNIEGTRGYIKQTHSDTSQMNTAKTLTATESLVPFEVNHDSDSRVGMTYLQTAKHAVRTKKSDPLLVTSGSDQALPYLTTDKFAFKAKQDGKVVEVNDNFVILEYKDGSKDYINLQETIEKNSDGGYYVPLKLDVEKDLKVGDKVKENQIVAYDRDSFASSLGESDNIAFEVGRLAKVAIISSDDGFEDSGVCTKKLSDDLTTKVIYKFEHMLEKDSLVLSYKKVGDIVNVDDSLLLWQDAFESEEDINHIMAVLGRTNLDPSELGRRSIRCETTGTVAGIKVYRTCEISDMSPSLQKFVKEYEKPIVDLKKTLDGYGINTKELPATYKLEATGKLKKADDAIYVEYYVVHPDKVAVGDKITYFSANKATEKSIIPEGKEPYTDFRPQEPVNALLSISSINHRMVTSIMLNGAMNKLLIELDRTIKDELGIPYDVTDL